MPRVASHGVEWVGSKTSTEITATYDQPPAWSAQEQGGQEPQVAVTQRVTVVRAVPISVCSQLRQGR
jgi:hypothetical protein